MARTISTEEMEDLTHQSLVTILWQAGEIYTEERFGPWDAFYGKEDATEDTVRWASNAIAAFIANNAEDVEEYLKTRDLEDLAHDYWLTRNHHGAGFWDRGLGDLGDRLTEAAEKDPEYYVFDDHVNTNNNGKWAAE